MKKKFLNLVLLIGIPACHTAQPYPEMLQTWIGKSEADLVATWGAPADMQTIAPNKQIFVYITEKQTFVPGEVPVGNLAYDTTGEVMGQSYDYYCTTTFTTYNDIITNYSYQGDGCLME